MLRSPSGRTCGALRLTRERDDALAQRDAAQLDAILWTGRAEMQEDRATAAEADAARLRAAAEPIARYAEEHGPRLDDFDGEIGELYRGTYRVSITYADLRGLRDVVRAALTPDRGGDDADHP